MRATTLCKTCTIHKIVLIHEINMIPSIKNQSIYFIITEKNTVQINLVCYKICSTLTIGSKINGVNGRLCFSTQFIYCVVKVLKGQ